MADSVQALGEILRRLPRLDESAIPSFEEAVAATFGATYAVALSSGTAALHCALAAVGVGPGDEVLVPALSVVMSAAPVLYLNATPVFVDCQPECIDFDYGDLTEKVSPRTKAVVPVHLWGCAYDMSRLVAFGRRHGLAVVEDACQAHGSMWDNRQLGTWGNVGCFSMHEGKLLSVGEGGFILTSEREIALRCRGFRAHWADPENPDRSYALLGWNYRLTRLQAVLAAEQVRRFDEVLSDRKRQATLLLSKLKKTRELKQYKYSRRERPNFYQVVMLLCREYAGWDLARVLARRGVVNSVGTFGLRPALDREMFRSGAVNVSTAVPNARKLLARVIALVVSCEQSDEDLHSIADTLERTVEDYRKCEEEQSDE